MKTVGAYVPLGTSKGHTPIYKQHRYFARRPHNQFNAIINHLTKPGDLILDCFAGGGVTLVEGLTLDRKVISMDVNPIAAMVQLGQVVEVEADVIEKAAASVTNGLPGWIKSWYETTCSGCNSIADVRWFEHAYLVNCPSCGQLTDLGNSSKAINGSGRQVAGRYSCNECRGEFKSVDTPRTGSLLLSLRVRCQECGLQESRPPNEGDLARVESAIKKEGDLVEEFNLRIPYIEIPTSWDRQAEDALRRKGFNNFSDLFSARNRIVLGFMFRELSLVRPSLTEEEYAAVILVFSSLIRYVNNMTISTSQWMDGRPVAWAKHAYWTPNQYVECNPFEYLGHRLKAMALACADRKRRFTGKLGSDDPQDVVNGDADFSVIRGDSRQIPVPDGSVKVVITDPPFGSNVQYGELTELWSTWLGDLNPFEAQQENIADEILVHRKKKPGQKSMEDYEAGLRAVFAECYRVLEDNGELVFTFNNKDTKAWHAVMAAAFSAGFCLRRSDVAYQPEIVAYRDTAHLRFDSELQGDVLYVFRKAADFDWSEPAVLSEWVESMEFSLGGVRSSDEWATRRIEIHLDAIVNAALCFQAGQTESATAWLEAGRSLTVSRGGSLRG